MDQTLIFAPFLTMILWTFVVWVYMYAKRIPFIQRSNLRPEQITAQELARISPPSVSNPSDNLKNLFEVPTLFYALLLYLYVTNQVDATYLTAAWVFVAFRMLHSGVHCTINIVMVRFVMYCISSFAVWFIAIRGALNAFA